MKKVLLSCLIVLTAATMLFAGGKEEEVSTGPTKTITCWTWKLAYIPGFEAAAEAYEAKTGVKVEFAPFSPDQTYKQKIKAALATDALPDIIHWWGVTDPEFIDKVADMRDHIDETWRSDFYPVAWRSVTVDQARIDQWAKEDTAPVFKRIELGHITGVPLDVGGFYIFYGNKKLIEKAGLDPSKAPADWEEFIDMMKTVKDKTGVPGLTWGGKFTDLYRNWCISGQFAMANGPEGFAKLLKREAKMSDPENLRVLKSVELLTDNDLLQPGLLNLTIDEADQAFFAGKAVYNLGGSFTMSTLMAMGMDPDDIVVYSLPPLRGSKYMQWKNNPFTLTMLSVPKEGKNFDDAMGFTKFITSPEGAALFAKNAYDIPAVDLGAAGMADQLPASLTPIVNSFVSESDYFIQMKENGVDFWVLSSAHEEWRVFEAGISKMVAGTASAEDVAAEFDNTMEVERAK